MMKRIGTSLIAGLVLAAVGGQASADRPDMLVSEWDELIDESVEMQNSSYGGSGGEGENPLYEPASIAFDPSEMWPGYPVRLEVQLEPELPGGVALPADGYAFDVKLFDQATEERITEFADGLTFVFEVPGLTEAQAGAMGMGFLDESGDAPRWVAEDLDLGCGAGGDDEYCGRTNHLSTFVVGPAHAIPEPSGLLMFAGASVMLMWRRRR